jgi:DNA-binding response OmpR family regulator
MNQSYRGQVWPEATGKPRSKVLIVDDDPAIVDAISLILEDGGYEVSSAFGGDIVSIAALMRPDIVLLDIRLSGQDGRDVCRALKTAPTTARIPVLMISANQHGAAYAQQAGADDYLAKPFEIDDILTKVAAWTSHRNTGCANQPPVS